MIHQFEGKITMTDTVQTKSPKQVAHEARNAQAKVDAAERRETAKYEGIQRGWMHNGLLKKARLQGLRAKMGLKPYEMTLEEASVFEGTSDEGGNMVEYDVPMTLKALFSTVPVGFVVTSDDEIMTEDGSFIAMIDDEGVNSTNILVNYAIISNDLDQIDEETRNGMLTYRARICELHEHILSLGGVMVASSDQADNDDNLETEIAA